MRKREVFNRTGLSQSTVYRMEKAGNFPRRIQISAQCVGWIEGEVDDWIRQRADDRVVGALMIAEVKAPAKGQGREIETDGNLSMPRQHVAVKDNEQPTHRGQS